MLHEKLNSVIQDINTEMGISAMQFDGKADYELLKSVRDALSEQRYTLSVYENMKIIISEVKEAK